MRRSQYNRGFYQFFFGVHSVKMKSSSTMALIGLLKYTQKIKSSEAVFSVSFRLFVSRSVVTFSFSKAKRDNFFRKMALYGHARVSTNDQDLALQIQMLRAADSEAGVWTAPLI